MAVVGLIQPSKAVVESLIEGKTHKKRMNRLQWEERQVGHVNVNLDMDIFVISEQKWLKFGLQAHFFKMFGHAKFQLSISSTFKVMKLLVKVTKYLH